MTSEEKSMGARESAEGAKVSGKVHTPIPANEGEDDADCAELVALLSAWREAKRKGLHLLTFGLVGKGRAQPATGTDEGLRQPSGDVLGRLNRIAASDLQPGSNRNMMLKPDDARAILAALSADNRAPVEEGWRLAPVELTHEMARAGAKGRQNSAISSFRDGWKLALAAAPTPPTASREDASDIVDIVGWQPRSDAIAELMEKRGLSRADAEREVDAARGGEA